MKNNTHLHLGSISESSFAELISSPSYKDEKKVIFTDENVHEHWIEYFITEFEELSRAEIIVIPSGEENKGLEICAQIWEALSEYEIGRSDIIINIGGGVITDMGGFIASTYKRGIRFINIPTTLLSQVDASVGGKTGIDLGPYKNQIGVFSEPEAVFIDSQFLSTLPQEEMISGYAEMLKHGLIADANYWKELSAIHPEKEREKLLPFIQRSVELKNEIVQRDPKEEGERKLLNFGHTIGHAIEGYCLKNGFSIPHGNAVAWGMIAEGFLSLNHGLSIHELDEITKYIRRIYPPLPIDQLVIPELLKIMLNDKKNKGGTVRFTLLKTLGKGVFDMVCNQEEIRNAFHLVLDREV